MSTPIDDSADFFSGISYGGRERSEEGIPRDQWGRPLIIDPETGELVAYTRASSMAGYIDSAYGLHQWQKSLVVQGLSHRDDLVAMAAALPPYDACNSEQKKTLREIVESALEVAKAYAKANWGTAVHAFTDPTHVSGPVPDEQMAKDVRSHDELIEATGIVTMVTELFVVNDRLQVAGTLDKILGLPALNVMVVGDTKTGRQDLHKTTIQMGSYAESAVYDPETGKRTPIPEYLAGMHDFDLPPFNPDLGAYVHIPRGEGKTTLHPLNLVEGRRMLDICAQVRGWQKSENFAKPDQSQYLIDKRRVGALQDIMEAETFDELQAVYRKHQWRWDERLNKAGATRLAEINRKASS